MVAMDFKSGFVNLPVNEENEKRIRDKEYEKGRKNVFARNKTNTGKGSRNNYSDSNKIHLFPPIKVALNRSETLDKSSNCCASSDSNPYLALTPSLPYISSIRPLCK